MKKKTISIILAMVMSLTLAACSGETSAPEANQSKTATSETAEAEQADEPVEDAGQTENETTEEANQTEETATEEALVLNSPVTVFDEGDVTIMVNPIENQELVISFANNSASKVNFKYDFINVNGYQVDDKGASSVEANSTYEKSIGLDDFFNALGSDAVASVELQGKLYDYATSTEIADAGYIFIQGEAYGQESADLVTDEAMLVYSNDKILAYIDPVFTTTDVDFTMRGFTINNTGESIWCMAENYSFNGTPYGGSGDFETAAGQRRFDKLIDQFYYSWIGVSSADEIETIEFDYTVGADMVHVTLANNAGTLSVVSVE